MRYSIGASESSFVYILGLCAGSMLCSVLNTFLLLGSFAGMNIMTWITYALNQVAFLIVVFGYGWMRHVSIPTVAHIRKPKNPKQLIIIPFLAIATIILFLPLSDLFMKLLGAMGYQISSVPMPRFENVGIYFMSLLFMAALPAIGEEFLMRGVLLNGLSTRSTWFGILISALLFSLMHQNPLQTVHQFGLGVVLAIVMIMSGSIWPCVLMHFLNNFMSITMTAYIPQIDQMLYGLGNWIYLTDIISIVVGFILVVCLLYLYYRLGQPKRAKYRAATDGIVYEEFAIYATPAVKAENKKMSFKTSMFADMCRFFASLFTKRGWRNVTNEISSQNDAVFLGRSQPMFNVWLAIAFAVFYWAIILIMGFI
ncbi:MAG: type II CAAX endopeptidase family protein [Clostridia bacterium]